MSEEFGPNFITLTDEDGNDIELEYVDALEDNGQTYMAFFPTVDDETDEAAAEDFGLVILKSVTENGEELLTTLDSDEELQRVYDLFMELLMDVDDENSGPVSGFWMLHPAFGTQKALHWSAFSMPETILANRKPFRENAEGRGPLPENSRGNPQVSPFIFPPGLLYYGCRRKTAPCEV